jgi:hypothetical protein
MGKSENVWLLEKFSHPNMKKTGCRGRFKLGETRVSGLGIRDTAAGWRKASEE